MAPFLTVISIVLLCRGLFVHSITTPAPCYDLPDPPNGAVKVTQHNSDPSRSQAIYSCDKGFALKGRPMRACCNSEWLGEDPECRQVCSIADFMNTVRVEVQSDGASTSTAAESVVLTCPDGYFPAGGDQRRCEGEWSQPAYPTPCLKECSKQENPENGKVVFNIRSGAVYFCDFGFQLIGSPERRCIDGHWTGTKPFCINQTEILGHHFGISGPDAFTKDVTTLKTADFLMPAARNGQPARRSVLFLYRMKPPRGGTVRVTVNFTLLWNETEVPVDTEKSTFQQEPGSDAFVLRPACIELFSDVTIMFRAVVQLDVSFLDAEETAFEIRDLETSQTQRCIDRIGECPPSLEASRCGTFCRHDGNCAEEQKCCSTSCGVDCLNLINTTQSNATQSNATQSNTTQNMRRRRMAPENNTPDNFDCDNTTDSGDCGYKGSGCSGSSTRWQVVANNRDSNESASSDSVEKVDLTPVDLRSNCDFDVCIQCLQQKSAHSKLLRRSYRVNFIQPAKCKSFCLFPNEDHVVHDLMRTDLISSKKSTVNFKLRMLKGGFHIMVVHLFCLNSNPIKFPVYEVRHFNHKIDHDLHHKIEVQGKINQCLWYKLEFEIALVFTSACVESIVFT